MTLIAFLVFNLITFYHRATQYSTSVCFWSCWSHIESSLSSSSTCAHTDVTLVLHLRNRTGNVKRASCPLSLKKHRMKRNRNVVKQSTTIMPSNVRRRCLIVTSLQLVEYVTSSDADRWLDRLAFVIRSRSFTSVGMPQIDHVACI